MTRLFVPSPQQAAIFAAVSDPAGGNLSVHAVAGAGKTTTLEHACRLMTGSVAFCAYNKKIADEIKARVSDLSSVRAGTFHSFGFSAWRQMAKVVKVEDKKLFHIQDDQRIPDWAAEFCRTAVSLAKQSAFGIVTPIDNMDAWYRLVTHFAATEKLPDDVGDDVLAEAIGMAQNMLRESNQRARDIIDFDDMIYAPLFFNARVWQNDWVLVDEAQDTNPARRALARKMLKAGGRLIAVGDPSQAIYGFTGADNDALELIEQEFGCHRMPLTTTYRCPKAVVTHARQWVSHIEAHESAPEGSVTAVAHDDFLQLPASAFCLGDAVLCRNTKPLVELAYHLIRRGIGAVVEGRDIGKGLLALVNKWKVSSLPVLSEKLESYRERETQKLLAKGQELRAAAIDDKVDTLQVIIQSVQPGAVSDLRAAIERLFGDTQYGCRTIVLSTVHKSKGREWDRVYLLGRNAYMPSKYARQQWQLDQETNLIYVAVTRAKQELIEVTVTKRK